MIDHNSATPMYVQIFEKLQAQILNGTLKGGDKLPSERELGNLYSASRITIRQALDLLLKQSLIFSVQGKGTFVKHPRVDLNLLQIRSFGASIQEKGFSGSTTLLEYKSAVTGSLCERFTAAGGGDTASCLELLGIISETPSVYYRSFIRPDLGNKIFALAVEQAQKKQIFSMFSLFEEIGCRISRVTQNISAAEADPAMSKLLSIPKGKALIRIESFTYDIDSKLVEHKQAFYRPDKYSFTLVRENMADNRL